MKQEKAEPAPQANIPADGIPVHRKMDTTVRDLKAHVMHKMGQLPYAAKSFGLSEETVLKLRELIQEELNYLNTLPEDVTLGEIIDGYLEREVMIRGMVEGDDNR